MSNPFDVGDDAFQSSGMSEPLVRGGGGHSEALPEEYNPFDGAQASYGTAGGAAAAGGKIKPKDKAGAHAAATTEDAWADDVPEGKLSQEELLARERRLREREKALDDRERELNEKERSIRAIVGQPNWPFPCWSFLYHDIKGEIPEQFQTLVRMFYALVLMMWVTLLYNWVVLLVIYFSAEGSLAEVFWCSVYVGLGAPGAWRLWYRTIYFATRDDSSRQWIMFFANFIAHLGYCAVMVIGIPNFASAGFYKMVKLFADHYSLAGLLCLVAAAVWALNIVCGVFAMKKAYSMWRSMGGDKKAKREAAKVAVDEAMEQKV